MKKLKNQSNRDLGRKAVTTFLARNFERMSVTVRHMSHTHSHLLSVICELQEVVRSVVDKKHQLIIIANNVC